MDLKKKLILTIVLMSYMVTAINAAIVITGLEYMAKDLHLNQSTLSWIQNAYVLSWGGFMLLGGRLSDTIGRKMILNVSLVLFGASSLVSGIATSASVMIVSRFVQGVGASMLAPSSLALIMDYFQGADRVKAIAWYSSISGLGMCVGLVIGGTLASFLSWRYGFFIYLPLVVFMFCTATKVLDKGKSHEPEHFDIIGTLLSTAGIFSLVYAINGASHALPWLICALVLLVLFVRTEASASAPITPLRIFNRERSCANIARVLFAGAMMGFYYFVSEYLQEISHMSPLWVGLAFFPLTIFTFFGAMRVPATVGRWGNLRTLFVGLTLMMLGFAIIYLLLGKCNYWVEIALPMALIGFGQGFVMSPLTNLGIKGVRKDDAGAASGIVNAAHQIGCSIGLSIIVSYTSSEHQMTTICQQAMAIGGIFTLLALVIAFSGKIQHMLTPSTKA